LYGAVGIQAWSDISGHGPSNWYIKNNIIYSGSYRPVLIYAQAVPDTDMVFENNMYYTSYASTPFFYGGGYSWAGWNGLGFDSPVGYYNQDPKFNNAGSDEFWLQSNSPAIDTGENLGSSYAGGLDPASSWPTSVSTLNQNSYGSGWEIGAYVFYELGGHEPPLAPSGLKIIE
jgi:hypothetical protein